MQMSMVIMQIIAQATAIQPDQIFAFVAAICILNILPPSVAGVCFGLTNQAAAWLH